MCGIQNVHKCYKTRIKTCEPILFAIALNNTFFGVQSIKLVDKIFMVCFVLY